MPRNPQISTTVPDELYKQIVEMAEKEKRTLSEFVALLLEKAVKERLRKR